MMRSALAMIAACLLVHHVAAEPPKKLLLIGQGPDGHPPATHEYLAGLKVLEKCLKPVAGLEIITAHGNEPWREGAEMISRSDGVVLFVSEGARWMQNDPQRFNALKALARRGGGVVGLHWGIGTRDAKNIDAALSILGGCHGGPDRKYQVLETDVAIPDPKHPIVTGIVPFRVRDEFYYKLKFTVTGVVTPILKARIDGADEPVAWAWQRPDGGRSFGFSGLHFHENWQQLAYRRLVAQGVLWSLKLPVPKGGLTVEVNAADLKLK